jgi:hypothetical protein
VAAPLAGQLVRASNYPRVRVIKKAAAESVTSSIVLQNDDDLSIALAAGAVFLIDAYIIVTGAAAGDLRVAWAVSGGVAQLAGRSCMGPQIGTADSTNNAMRSSGAHSLTTSLGYGTDGAAGSSCQEHFLVETTTANTPGTLTMQWAQFTSSATSTTLAIGTFMVITEVDLQ